MDITSKWVIDLTVKEFLRCYELTYGTSGWMQEELWAAAKNEALSSPHRHSYAVLAKDGDTIVGWSLLQPIRHASKYKAYFFVDPSHRRRGIGTRLLNAANTFGRYRPEVVPDSSNIDFFERNPELWTMKGEDLSVQWETVPNRSFA